jgi:hypothetical protein
LSRITAQPMVASALAAIVSPEKILYLWTKAKEYEK